LSYEPTPENIKRGTADAISWQIYGLGKRAKPEGLIFPNWEIVKDFPNEHSWQKWGYSIDYGFTNDPTALCKIVLAGGELYVKELFYERGLVNLINPQNSSQKNIESELIFAGVKKYTDEVVAESAEPKTNRELSNAGFMMVPVAKFPGCVKEGIELLKRYKVNIVTPSVNLIKEKNNYKWRYDANTDRWLNEPIDNFNHLIDAIRNWALTKLYNPNILTNKKIRTKSELGLF